MAIWCWSRIGAEGNGWGPIYSGAVGGHPLLAIPFHSGSAASAICISP